MLFPTTLVGSYPQPEWLIDRKKLAGRFPPRVRAKELWRVSAEFLAEARCHPGQARPVRGRAGLGDVKVDHGLAGIAALNNASRRTALSCA